MPSKSILNEKNKKKIISVLFQPTKNAFVLLTFCFQNEGEKKRTVQYGMCKGRKYTTTTTTIKDERKSFNLLYT
jgi:hypothetical protein